MPDTNDQDALAASIATSIAAEPARHKQEFVATVFRNAQGELEATALFTNGSYYSAPLGQALKSSGGAGNVVAVVHNHPSALADLAPDREDSLYVNSMPSDGDWKTADGLFKSRNDVAYYVLGPDDVLRRYEYADRARWDKANHPGQTENEQRRNRLGTEIEYEKPAPAHSQDHSKQAAAAHIDELRSQVSLGVGKLDRAIGKDFDESSARMVEGLTLLAAKNGLERVDHVALSIQGEHVRAGEHVFVVQGGMTDPTNRVAFMKTADALSAPAPVTREELSLFVDRQVAMQPAAHEAIARTAGRSLA